MSAGVIGAALLLLAALLVIRAFRATQRTRREEYLLILSLLDSLHRYMSTRLLTVDKFFSSSECEAVEKLGLRRDFLDTGSAYLAFSRASRRLLIGERSKRALSSYFQKIGSGYLGEELSALDAVRREVSEDMSATTGEDERSLGVLSATAVCVAIGAILLFI